MAESSFHVQLKDWYAKPGDKVEHRFGDYVIDLVRGDLLIEIQTQSFSALKEKLKNLTSNHKVRLIHPIITDKWIAYGGKKRLSPKHCTHLNLFDELVYMPKLLANPNLSIETVLVQVEELRERKDNKGVWRRRNWSLIDKRLIKVIESKVFHNPNDLLKIIPQDITTPFTNRDLSKRLDQPIKLVRKMTYCLRKMNALEVIGKKGNAFLFMPSF